MPAETFGKTIKGLTEGTRGANYPSCNKYQSGSAGTLASITLYVKNYPSGSKIKCAIYDAVGPNLLANGTTEEKDIAGSYDGWVTFNFPVAPTVLAATNYYLCWWQTQTGWYYHDAGAANQFGLHNKAYDTWPVTLTLFGQLARAYTIYATYTEPPEPTAPTSLEVDGKSTPTGANCVTSTPQFTAIYNDPDAGDTSNAFQIQVGSASGLSDMWDSGWLVDATVEGNRCGAKNYAGAALSEGTSYWWRCRFRDDENNVGAWSAWQQFDVCAAEPEPEVGLLECAPGGPLPKRCPFRCAVALPRRVSSWAF